MKNALGFFLLIVGVAAVLGGIGAVSRDVPIGWVGVAAGIGANAASFRLMRAPTNGTAQRSPVVEASTKKEA